MKNLMMIVVMGAALLLAVSIFAAWSSPAEEIFFPDVRVGTVFESVSIPQLDLSLGGVRVEKLSGSWILVSPRDVNGAAVPPVWLNLSKASFYRVAKQ